MWAAGGPHPALAHVLLVTSVLSPHKAQLYIIIDLEAQWWEPLEVMAWPLSKRKISMHIDDRKKNNLCKWSIRDTWLKKDQALVYRHMMRICIHPERSLGCCFSLAMIKGLYGILTNHDLYIGSITIALLVSLLASSLVSPLLVPLFVSLVYISSH